MDHPEWTKKRFRFKLKPCCDNDLIPRMSIVVPNLVIHARHPLLAAGADVDSGAAGHLHGVAVAVDGEAVVPLAQIIAAVSTKDP